MSEVDFDRNLVEPLIKMLDTIEKDKERLESKLKMIKKQNDKLRNLLYHEYRAEWFPKKLPKEFKNQATLLRCLDNLNDGVGYAIRVVLKYRYSEPQVLMEKTETKKVENPTVVIQQPQQPQGPIAAAASRVKTFWTGWHERSMLKEELKYLREKEAEKPRITTSRVVRDPVEIGNEISAVLVETKKFIMDCFRCLPVHYNRWFVLNVHDELRERATKLLSTLEAFVVACTEIDLKDLRLQQIAQTGYFARIAEARAMQPMFYPPMGRPRPYGGYSDYRIPEKEIREILEKAKAQERRRRR